VLVHVWSDWKRTVSSFLSKRHMIIYAPNLPTHSQNRAKYTVSGKLYNQFNLYNTPCNLRFTVGGRSFLEYSSIEFSNIRMYSCSLKTAAALVTVAIFESQRRLNAGLFGFSLLQYGGFTFLALAVFLFVSIYTYPWIHFSNGCTSIAMIMISA